MKKFFLRTFDVGRYCFSSTIKRAIKKIIAKIFGLFKEFVYFCKQIIFNVALQ